MKKIAVINNKGGVGKSTVSVQIAHGLALKGFKILLIDLDGQNDSSMFLGFTQDDYKNTFFDLINNRNCCTIEECIISARENLDLLPSMHIEQINSQFHRISRIDLVLNELLAGLESLRYDYVIIDCGPQRTKINDAVLCYVDNIVLPVQVEAASVRAIGNIYEYLADLRLDPDMISLVIPNMFDQRTNDSKENLEFLKEFFSNSNILSEPIHRRIKLTEAGKLGKTVFEFDNVAANQFSLVVERLIG
ncbi:ParA family protein [Pseudobacteroides cellulosolvens]|nr:ParA family protein [Pseudobacteroides cellulosolvens]